MYTYTDRELSLPGCFVQYWCMQQKVHLLNVNNIGKDMGEEIYSNTLFNRLWHYQCADVLVPPEVVPTKLIENPSPTSSSTFKAG